MSEVQQEQQAEATADQPKEVVMLRPSKVFVTRPEQVFVYELEDGVTVDEAIIKLGIGVDQGFRAPIYFLAGAVATHLLAYERSRQVVCCDHLHMQCLTLQLPQREDGVITCNQAHIESILDTSRENTKVSLLDNNTVASLRVKGTSFRVQGESGCVDPLAYNEQLGIDLAVRSAADKVYPLEGYAISRIASLAGVLGERSMAYSFDGRMCFQMAEPLEMPVASGMALRKTEDGQVEAVVSQGIPTLTHGELESILKAMQEQQAAAETAKPAQADEAQVLNSNGHPVPQSALLAQALSNMCEQGARELTLWETQWNSAAERDAENPDYQDLASVPGVVIKGAHQFMIERGFGLYLLDLNGQIQHESGNTRMFFHVQVGGQTELALLPKIVGAYAELDDQGNLKVPEENLSFVDAVMP